MLAKKKIIYKMEDRSFRKCLPKGFLLIHFEVNYMSPTVSDRQPHTNTKYIRYISILTITPDKENSGRVAETWRAQYSQDLMELL